MSWLVAPQCTYRAASASMAATRTVRWRTSGNAILPACTASTAMAAWSKYSALAADRIAATAEPGMTPTDASAAASATSTSSIIWSRV